jgi:hypothetical protein
MEIMKLLSLALVLYVGYYFSMFLYRRGRDVIADTENLPVFPTVSRLRGTVKRPFFLHYIHHGHIHRLYKASRAERRRWFQDAV